MQIYPAIDLRGGKCVRLRQGDYSQETIFGDDPAAVARHWAAAGATYLHLVDLDGAREGRPVNGDSVRRIVAAARVRCQLGGGLREGGHLETALSWGVTRVILGTRALQDPEWCVSMCRRFPGKVALGIDASQRSVGSDTATGVLLGRLRDELQAAIVEIRRLAHGLRPPVLDRIGLVPAIREYAGALASRSARSDGSDDGTTIVLEVPTVLPKLPASVDVAAYRIICEALTNVTRHASARSCAVRLWIDDDLHIEVVDDGIGIDAPSLTDGGVGLSSMRERAAELGGECLVEADREGGTRVFATLPLPKEVV